MHYLFIFFQQNCIQFLKMLQNSKLSRADQINKNSSKKKSLGINKTNRFSLNKSFNTNHDFIKDCSLTKISSKINNNSYETTPTKTTANKNTSIIKTTGKSSININVTSNKDHDKSIKLEEYNFDDTLSCDIPSEIFDENDVTCIDQSQLKSNCIDGENDESCSEIIPETPNQTISTHDQCFSSTPLFLMNESSCEDTIISSQKNLLENLNDSNEKILACLNVTELSSSANSNNEQSNNDTFYDLPIRVRDYLFHIRGIKSLYSWQNHCLKLPAVRKRKNLIYSLPTSGGKTLVAELLIMKEIIKQKKNVIFVLPYVSIVQEKVRELSPFAVEFNFHVEEYAASRGILPPRKRRKKNSVYIATIEKANAIVNSLVELNREDELGMIVIDELHMIGEGGGRGALLEILISKVLYKFLHVQVIGMSATFGNIEELKTFLNAELYIDDFRPVELIEYAKMDDTLYEINKNSEELYRKVRTVTHAQNTPSAFKAGDPDHILTLVLEVIPQNSCLIFCSTKKNCENVALMLAKSMPRELMVNKKEERQQLLDLLKSTISGVCFTLKSTIAFGIAYHHSGLTMDERKLIEEAYSSGVLCLLCCTSTLAAGVNLPAKRVILRSPYIGNAFLMKSQYKQMVGRAGRAGIDTSGESIIILQQKDKVRARELLEGPIGSCKSSLSYQDGKGFRHLILTLLGLKICMCLNTMESFFKKTLHYIQLDDSKKSTLLDDISKEINHLVKLNMLVIIDEENEDIQLTSLGQATYKGCMDIDKTPFIYEQLKHALSGMVLANELHLLYLATPVDHVENLYLKWMLYYNQVNKLNPVNLKTAEFVGVTESVLSKKAAGKRCSKDSFDEFIYKRFFLALVLFELLKKKSVLQVSETYEVSRGFLQNLLVSSISYTSLLIHFTAEISEFWVYKILFQALLERLSNTSSIELAPLLEIPGIKEARAHQLFKCGYRTLQHLASVNPEKLSADIRNLPRNQARLITASAKMILQEKIESLREEADEIAALPLL
ncbi:helicase POLQ-like isoform X3 [Hydra vulgaris]|uniref:Helicase POLQ-like isoform X3 n=1 Tax=Hydra vulgaris TaxID=6087 RepID=A0ABM4CX81_HYDVU